MIQIRNFDHLIAMLEIVLTGIHPDLQALDDSRETKKEWLSKNSDTIDYVDIGWKVANETHKESVVRIILMKTGQLAIQCRSVNDKPEEYKVSVPYGDLQQCYEQRISLIRFFV